ncbi:MAG: hypothetical protein P9M10_07355 [Candidatus Euphemobacter frigidus]|nr:hypothetical protein [Candidatus Euphemobacter frigidus]
MRKLIYVPVIHMSADLGSVARQVDKKGIAGFGEEFWRKHRETISKLWDVIFNYFIDLDVKGFKIYQDGMVADGEVGEKIVEEGVKAGSKNYEIISDLLKRGALLVKTEDFPLVKKERDRIVRIANAGSTGKKLTAYLIYRLTRDRLLKKRDRYIAERINETLRPWESGILFIGAYHDVIPPLPDNILITEVKETNKVRNYQRLLLRAGKNKEEFEGLAEYLGAPEIFKKTEGVTMQ